MIFCFYNLLTAQRNAMDAWYRRGNCEKLTRPNEVIYCPWGKFNAQIIFSGRYTASNVFEGMRILGT